LSAGGGLWSGQARFAGAGRAVPLPTRERRVRDIADASKGTLETLNLDSTDDLGVRFAGAVG
jgi:hypothetical protein